MEARVKEEEEHTTALLCSTNKVRFSIGAEKCRGLGFVCAKVWSKGKGEEDIGYPRN